MANKKHRKRPRPPASGGAQETTRRPQGADPGKRERKDQARHARERARKLAARRERTRRGVSLLAAGAVGLGVVWFINRAAPPDQLSDRAQAEVTAAGCTGPDVVLADEPPGGQHLGVGESTTYEQRPATSGFHAPSPLPNDPNVFTEPVDETQAVHFLEHAGIALYYREESIPQDVIDRLASVANAQRNTFLAPYPDLPEGADLAFASWNRTITCPGVTVEQAGAIARGFAQAFACTSVGPEPNASPEC